MERSLILLQLRFIQSFRRAKNTRDVYRDNDELSFAALEHFVNHFSSEQHELPVTPDHNRAEVVGWFVTAAISVLLTAGFVKSLSPPSLPQRVVHSTIDATSPTSSIPNGSDASAVSDSKLPSRTGKESSAIATSTSQLVKKSPKEIKPAPSKLELGRTQKLYESPNNRTETFGRRGGLGKSACEIWLESIDLTSDDLSEDPEDNAIKLRKNPASQEYQEKDG
jgi:hypothetical protein